VLAGDVRTVAEALEANAISAVAAIKASPIIFRCFMWVFLLDPTPFGAGVVSLAIRSRLPTGNQGVMSKGG
jgi:hypothetical protein